MYKDQNSNNQQFALYQNKNGSYRILSKCSNFKSGPTIKSKSCSKGGNVIQYKYNGSHNDEWYLEPVKKVIVTVLSMPEKMQQYLHLQVPTPIYQVWAEIVQTLYLNVWLRVGYIIKIVGMFIKK